MRHELPHTLLHLWKGQTIVRIRMNLWLSKQTLRGKVVDIGGGHRPDYFTYFQTIGEVEIQAEDTAFSGINFEQDFLPYKDASVDTIILCNVLEHIFNYNFLLREIQRIMKPSAQLIGFVPFWVGYHPDPHDYFRYTHESLEKILKENGFTNVYIQCMGGSPILANFNTLVLSFPRFIRPVIYLPYALFDKSFCILGHTVM